MHPAPLPRLGLRPAATGAELRVWSGSAQSMELRLFSPNDPDWITERIPMQRDDTGVFTAHSEQLVPGATYAVGVSGPSGPTHHFAPERSVFDPYARGLVRSPRGAWRAHVVDESFDWGGVAKPQTPLDQTVIYEAHVKGFTKLHHGIPEHLRGTYAGLAHPATIDYLRDLGITAIELLPIHQSVSEQRLITQGRGNFWGYNTLSFFTPHDKYGALAAQHAGPGGTLAEFKSAVRALHEAGIEVLLDVVYNHTAEEGVDGPVHSLRAIDNANYYRQDAEGRYVDVTGCGNTLNVATPAARQLVLDSLKYWANECQVDGFRFDLAPALGRDEDGDFSPDHPLLRAIIDDPELQGVKMIAEPWDVGPDGWQVGNFGAGWSEWNDGFRDQARTFWLSDYRAARHNGEVHHGVGALAHAIAGSTETFGASRGPLASVNFVTAHDGFTLTDLVRYDRKHNAGNGEDGRDGSDHNRSFNHGVEGWTDDTRIRLDRRVSMRNLMGTLLLSAGVPMITMGDEYGRTARGNNNAYCHDSALTWLLWDRKPWHDEMFASTKLLTRLRRELPALRPALTGVHATRVPAANEFHWFNAAGDEMTIEQWDNTEARTLQVMMVRHVEGDEVSRVLISVQGSPYATTVTMPTADGVTGYELLWDSTLAHLDVAEQFVAPEDPVELPSMSMRLWRVLGTAPTFSLAGDHPNLGHEAG